MLSTQGLKENSPLDNAILDMNAREIQENLNYYSHLKLVYPSLESTDGLFTNLIKAGPQKHM